MKWSLKEMQPSDMVRVPSGGFYHYGICVDENTIIQFGESVVNPLVDPNTVEVNATTVDDFLRGRFAEVAEYDKKELKRKNSPEKIIAHARASIGRKGYHILYNNCEHFANECVFNDHASTQLDEFRRKMAEQFPLIDVYVATVDRFSSFKKLPKYAKNELKSVTNQSLMAQKRASYGLLECALEASFKLPLDIKSMFKDERGKPHLKDKFFSVSHTSELVCVAVSGVNIGVDIEEIKEHVSLDRTRSHIALDGEEATTVDEMIALWTKKEAIFKFDDAIASYNPSKIDTSKYQSKTSFLQYNGKKYALSLASSIVSNVNVILLDGEAL